jgi:hypothetical protein
VLRRRRQAWRVRRELTVEGGADADDVWDRYVRPARWPEWSPQIRSVEYGSERLVAGTAGVVHGVGGLRVPFTVTGVDEADRAHRSWTWRARVMGVELAFEHVVEPAPSGAATRLIVTGPPPVVLGYLPVAWVALRRLVA